MRHVAANRLAAILRVCFARDGCWQCEHPADSPGSVMTPMERREVYFSGRVQGVGFRYATRAIAARVPVSGFVENLRDGRVHMVVEGPAEAIRTLIESIQAEMDRYIDHTDIQAQSPTGEFDGFEIRH